MALASAGERLETIGDFGKRSALRCIAQLLRSPFQVGGDPLLFEALFFRAGPGRRGADSGLLHSVHGGDHFLGAISQPIHSPHASFVLARVVFVEGSVYALQHCCQRDARLAPGFNQRPIDGGQQKQRPAAALEVFFNLSKVVEVILHDCVRRAFPLLRRGCA